MPVQRDINLRLRNFAPDLRKASIDAEKKLWTILRSRQLAGFKFRRQYPLAGYILDFYCVSAKLAIELNGGQHNDPLVIEHDQRRTTVLTDIGVKVVRYWDHEVLQFPETVAEDIYDHLMPSPSSSPRPVLRERASAGAAHARVRAFGHDGSSRMPSPPPSPGVPGEGARGKPGCV